LKKEIGFYQVEMVVVVVCMCIYKNALSKGNSKYLGSIMGGREGKCG
jgi:Ca2+/H+ antiporter